MDARGLKPNNSDHIATAVRAAASLCPYGGGIVGEVISNLIPNQRAERIARFAAKLQARLDDIERERLQEKVQRPDSVDLVEDGFWQAARALQDDRLERIATLIARGLSQDDHDLAFSKRLLYLLGQLTDIELLILYSYTVDSHTEEGREFWDKHHELIHGPQAVLGSSEAEAAEAAIQKTSERPRLGPPAIQEVQAGSDP